MIALLILTSPSMDEFYRSEIERYRQWLRYELMDLENKPFDVKKYEYEIYLDTNGDTIGYAIDRIKFLATSSTDSVWLHFVMSDSYNNLTIDSVVFEYGSLSYPVSYTSIQPKLIVHLGTTVSAGDEFYLTFYYHGQVGQDGFVGEGMEFQENYIHTQGEMYGTRRWLPSYDEPYEKADTVIATIIVDTPWFAVANGKLVNVDTLGDKYAYTWLESYPITPYLIVLAASNRWKVLEQTWNYNDISMPVYEWVDSVHSFYGNLPDVLTIFSNIYGTYPFYREKFSQVDVNSSYFYGGMENQTNTFVTYPASQFVFVHELGHHWWGNWVTCGSFDDIWLNEGFTTYSDAVYLGATGGYPAYKNAIESHMEVALMNGHVPLHGPDFYDNGWGIVYYKGSSVLHMMRMEFRKIYGGEVAGDTKFFEFLRYYGKRHAYSYATTEDLKNDIEAFTGVDWDLFFYQWIYTPGFPIFDVYWGQEGNTLTIRVNQIQPSNWGYFALDYPIEIVFGDNSTRRDTLHLSGVQSEIFTLTVSGTVDTIIMDPNKDYLDRVYRVVSSKEAGNNTRNFFIAFQKGHLHIRTPVPDDYTVEIYNIQGRKVLEDRFSGNELTKSLNIPNGLYIYRVLSETNNFEGKIMIQN